MYAVFHKYDVDGGFGDAIEREDLIRVFDTQGEAEAFKKKYERPHVYDVPYCELWCGTLEVRALPIFSHEDDFWWLREAAVDFNDSEDSEDSD